MTRRSRSNESSNPPATDSQTQRATARLRTLGGRRLSEAAGVRPPAEMTGAGPIVARSRYGSGRGVPGLYSGAVAVD
jgi:hypothetical protein